jgi:hypothetical protein
MAPLVVLILRSSTSFGFSYEGEMDMANEILNEEMVDWGKNCS